ncbi:MAG: glycoside hydrolase family 3 C-terminal domain-containing protein [Candidatus Marinimicrobia bacterium]|nr:glycoside hydrolase family 3 C-terminal domain-containing protein [Candidatus Neomarinimicrobiota bacterium]
MVYNNAKRVIISIFLLLILFGNQIYPKTFDEEIDSLISEMTLQEKIDQLRNNGFMTTPANKKLGIPGFVMDDGPHGVRFETATCFPLTMSMAAMWDRNIWHQLGTAMGEEFQAFSKHVQLGPCIDLCRDPRNGRSGESGGEDPYLCGQLAVNLIQGIQSNPVIATPKHYNCVNRQDNRNSSNVIITEHQLMDHYGYNFRKAVQEGGALAIMSSYNLINGQHASESNLLLNKILKERWGFPFMVMSDWGSIHNSEKAIEAGNDLCMGNDKYKNDLLNLVNQGKVSEETINTSVKYVLKTKMLSGMLDAAYPQADQSKANSAKHQELCRLADQKGIVLLKNQDDILPIPKNKTIALIGPSANKAQMNIFGSSKVTPPYSISPQQGIENKIGSSKVSFAKGCDIFSNDTSGFNKARELTAENDYVIFVGGLDETVEGEGYGKGGDRKNNSIQLPQKQQMLINELAQVNPNLIVILESGGVCAVSNCIDNIKGFLYSFYTSQEGGNALADVLFGDYNPAGRLPVTMPQSDALMPAINSDFTDDFNCGYRYYDMTGNEYQYAFGYGLSYTDFAYNKIDISPSNPTIGDTIQVSVEIENIGDRAGEEVVQLYLTNSASNAWHPKKELKDFKRIALQAGESKSINFTLDIEDFYDYDRSQQKYIIEEGKYIIKVGGSSDELPLAKEINLIDGSLKSDLRAVNIYTYPRYPEKNDQVLLLATIKNYGVAASTNQNLIVSWKIDGESIAVSETIEQPILPGEMRLISCATELPNSNYWTPEKEMTYEIEVIVDPENTEDEYYEDNNRSNKIVKVFDKPPANLALNCPVTASSIEENPPENVDPENVNDGDMSTRWSSAWSDPQSITLDLGEMLNFNRINIHWEAAYASQYYVQISDNNEDWQNIREVTNSNGGLDQINVNSKARYIRIYGTERATEYGYSIYEIEVFNLDTETQAIQKEIQGKTHRFELNRIYPNPFNNSTRIKYSINDRSFITLRVYNIIGEYINTLVEKKLDRGAYETAWPGTNSQGEQAPSGIYLLCMAGNNQAVYKKMAYIK